MSVKPAKTKPSGVAWIGDIPEGWGIGRVKNSFYHTKEVVKERAAEFDRLALTLQGVIKRPKEDTNGLQPKEFEGYQVLRKNELVFKLIDLQNISTSRVGRSSYDGIVSPAYIILHSRDNSSTAFACYYFLSMWMHNIFQTLGGDAVRSCLNASDLLNVPLLRPPLPEQRAIADYLDDKCGAIDEAIVEAKKGIEEYKAWKKSLIFEVVTGKRRVGFFNAESQSRRVAESFSTGLTRFTGLGKNLDNPVNPVKTKPSGVPWIGDVPVGWEVSRVKNVAIIQHGQDPKTDGDIPVYGSGEGSFKTCGEYKYGPTVLIGRKGATLHIPHYIEGKYWNVDTAFDVKMKNSDILRWFYYLAICFDYKAYMSQTTLPSMTQSDYRNMVIPLPNTDEQRAIADYLDEKCAAIDKMAAEKEALIADLEAYKKSLIYETVTGKREVR